MRYCSSCILFLAHDFMQPFLRSSLAVAYKALKTTMIISMLLPYSAVEIYDFPVYCILLVKYSSLKFNGRKAKVLQSLGHKSHSSLSLSGDVQLLL